MQFNTCSVLYGFTVTSPSGDGRLPRPGKKLPSISVTAPISK